MATLKEWAFTMVREVIVKHDQVINQKSLTSHERRQVLNLFNRINEF